MRRFRTWFLIGALVICLALFVGLFHDFSLSDPSQGWFTQRPGIPIALLVIGYLCMIGQRMTGRSEE